MSNIVSPADYKKAVHNFGTAYQKVKDSQDLDRIVAAATICAVISKLEITELKMYLVLTEEFLKGEVAGITDEAYNELHTDLLKKLMFMIDSFFKQHEIDFTTLSKQKAYTGFLGKIWFKIQIEIIDEASKDYLLHFDCYYGKEVFDNFFDLINHLKAILEK